MASSANAPGPRLSSPVVVYAAMIVATVGVFWLISSAGQALVAPQNGKGLRSGRLPRPAIP